MILNRGSASPDADPASTIALVRRAKNGDTEAWNHLIDRYYDAWLSRYHGDLGTTLRRIYDTEDAVQSAVGEAFKEIAGLRDESVFFVWVTSILRHKVALRYRQNRRQQPLREEDLGSCERTASPARGVAESVEFTDTYLSVLDAIIAAFPKRPKWMSAFVMRHLDDLEVSEIARRLGVPERTAFHWVASGSRLLRERLSASAASGHVDQTSEHGK